MIPVLNADDASLLEAISTFARTHRKELYVVGGYLRDLLLKRRKDPVDIDCALSSGAIPFGRKLARKLKAGFVVLDAEHGCCRLVVRRNGRSYTVDLTDFRGPTLADDLYHRDFTVNCLAMRLDDLRGGTHALIDPHKGLADLRAKRIRMVNRDAFSEDPLRILRAFSMRAQTGFSVEAATLARCRAQKALLANVSYERIRDELFKVLETARAFEVLVEMDGRRVLTQVLPELEVMRAVRQGPYHHLDVWKHCLQSVRELECVCAGFKRLAPMQGYLTEQLSPGRSRLALVRLASLVHDIGKPRAKRRKGAKTVFYGHDRIGSRIADALAQRLKLSNDEAQALRLLVLLHLRPGYLGDHARPSPRSVFRFFRAAGRETVATLLLSLADQRATRGRLTTPESAQQHERVCRRLVKEWFAQQAAAPRVRLVDGNDLMRHFHLEPSPLIGTMLRHIEEQQALGRVTTAAQALAAVKKFAR